MRTILICLAVILCFAYPWLWLVVGGLAVVYLVLKTLDSMQPKYSKRDMQAVLKSAQRLIDIIDESKEIIKSSSNPETKISRLKVAQDNWQRLQDMFEEYPFLVSENFKEYELELGEIAFDIERGGFAAMAQLNLQGQEFEKKSEINKAINVYEQNISGDCDTPFPYRRLAIIYRKKKMSEDEIRVLKSAIKNIPVSNAQHLKWFEDRYKKIVLKF